MRLGLIIFTIFIWYGDDGGNYLYRYFHHQYLAPNFKNLDYLNSYSRGSANLTLNDLSG